MVMIGYLQSMKDKSVNDEERANALEMERRCAENIKILFDIFNDGSDYKPETQFEAIEYLHQLRLHAPQLLEPLIFPDEGDEELTRYFQHFMERSMTVLALRSAKKTWGETEIHEKITSSSCYCC
jgi:hypothetical protein